MTDKQATVSALVPGDGRVFHVVAEDAQSLQDELAAARAIAAADNSHGILVIRRSRFLFTVEISAQVPYGTTLERDRWQRHDHDRR